MTIVDRHWPRADVWLATDHPEPDMLVVGVPSSRASIAPSRADLTPGEVRTRLHRFSTFHGELGIDFGSVAVRDFGNWPVSEHDPETLIDEVTRRAADLPDVGLRLFLGGDNAITRPLVAAQSADLSTVGVITFDAHHDVRALEDGPTNGTPIRGLIEEHGLPGQNVTQIGIHSFANSAGYRAYCDDAGIACITVDQVERAGMAEVIDIALGQLSSTCASIYVDVDLDVLDRAFAPACPGARPGGLTVRQLSEGVARCAASPLVRAMDFVEVDLSLDQDFQTLDVMAHLLLTAASGFATR